MDDLIIDFIAECRDMLGALEGEIVAWESEPGDRARLDSIFRFVHTVKGNCGFFDFPRLEALSHAAEGALADVRAGRRQADQALVSAVLAIIDRIGEMVAAIESGEEFPEGSESALIDALEPDADAGDDVVVPIAVTAGDGPSKLPAAPRSIRLSVELLDQVMSGVSDMVLARNDLARRLRTDHRDDEVDGSFARLSTIIADMRNAITRTRMQRVEALFTGLPRLVRDLSAELGKQVMVDIESGDVELDREMIEMIRDPLTHIIRNAIDHGIETPVQRRTAGKREIGMLTVSARQSGNQILIEIADDGRGIDGARLVEKAIAAEIIDASECARLSARERYGLIFKPGLSTAESVSAVSGRGVGMDVVRSNVERIGGVVEVDSVPGQGTSLTLRVPLTLTIISALTVSVASQHFAIPRTVIEEIVHTGASSVELTRIGDAMMATIRGRRVPCISLASVLGLPHELTEADLTLIVLRPAGGDVFTLAVDRIHDHEELVVKPAAPAVMASAIYAGTTLADDGSPILLLDAAGLAQVGGLQLQAQQRSARMNEPADTAKSKLVRRVLLFIGIDGRRRAMPVGIIDRIEEVDAAAVKSSAGRVRVVVDGRLLPLAGLGGATIPPETVGLLRLNDGQSEIGYAVQQVIDMTAIVDEPIPAEIPGEIEGVTLIDGEPVELVDPHWLFAYYGNEQATDNRLLCRLPLDDPWVQNFLRPLVESANYRIVDTTDEIEADIAFVQQDWDSEPGPAAQVIRLRNHLGDPTGNSGSIYRYDRPGLMIALTAAAAGRSL